MGDPFFLVEANVRFGMVGFGLRPLMNKLRFKASTMDSWADGECNLILRQNGGTKKILQVSDNTFIGPLGELETIEGTAPSQKSEATPESVWRWSW